MKDGRRRHQDAVAVRRPEFFTHHHYVTRARWSPKSLDHDASPSITERGWQMFRTGYQSSLASVSTDRAPLMRAETSNTSASGSSPAELHLSFTEKYGRCLEILHYGSNGTVRLHQSKIPTPGSKSKLVAVKVYRSYILDSSSPLTTSTCSAAAIAGLHPRHPNILPITDLLHNERSELCLVMPYCAGGDLHELLSRTGALPSAEADCLVAQVLRALAFLHEHDTAHRDIRLETILLTDHGSVKLAGFGDGHIRRIWHECVVPTEPEEAPPSQRRDSSLQHSSPWSLPWLISVFLRSALPRLAGEFTSSSASFLGISLPYIPPEGFRSRSHAPLRREDPDGDNEEDHDPRPADVWAVAIVYLVLITGRLPWRSARPSREDPQYVEYLHCRQTEDGYPPIEALGHRRRNAIYAMLHPNPRGRITTRRMLQSNWMDGVSVCEAGEMGY